MTDLLIFQAILSSSSLSHQQQQQQHQHQHQIIQDNNLYANIYDPADYFDNYTSDTNGNSIYYDLSLNRNFFQQTFNKTVYSFDNYDVNSLSSNTTTKSLLLLSPSLTILLAILSGLMSLITILGNILVITAFIIDKNLRSYSNYFILNLSIADLLIGLLIPPYAPFLLGNRRWVIGRAACTIWLVLDYVVGSASVLCIVVISLDRYLLVSKGLSYVSNQRISKAICIMMTVWIIAFLNYAPAIVFWELISGKSTVPEDDCQVEFHDNLPYLTATACVEFFVPLISICSLNIAVYLNIRKRSKGLIRSKKPHFCLNNDNNNNINNNNNKSKNNYQKGLHKAKSESANILNNNNTIISNKSIDTSVKLKSNTNKVIISITPSTSSASSEMIPSGNSNVINNDYANTTNSSQNSPTNKLNLKQCGSFPLFDSSLQQKSASPASSKEKSAKKKDSKLRNSHSENSTLIKINDDKNKSKRKQTSSGKNTNSSLSKDKKAARSLFVLVFVFVCCWAPYTSTTLIKSVCPTCVDETFYEFTFWLLWLNSTFNPILYPFLHVKFRKAFAKIICCCLKRSKFSNKSKSFLPGNNDMNQIHEHNRLLTTNTSMIRPSQQLNSSPIKKTKFDV